MTLLVIAESREKGEKIADAMGLKNRGNKCLTGVYNGKKAVLCWASGHLFEPVQPETAKPDANWFKPESLLPLPTPGKMQLSSEPRIKELFSNIKSLVASASEVWIGTDADKEGEAIGRDILKYAKYNGPIKRLWFSGALEKEDVDKAIREIHSSEDKLPTWRAQQARQGADWLWQFLVRAYTMQGRVGLLGTQLGQGKGRESVVSVGRVQTPTLKMIVDRDNAIKNFKKIDYFLVSPRTGAVAWMYKPPAVIDPADGITFDDNDKPYFISKPKADAFKGRLLDASIVVSKAAKGTKVSHPPIPHSLTTLQRAMSSKYGITAANTLKITDKVRLNGYLTYPRTEHGEIPISLYTEEYLVKQLNAAAVVPDLKAAALAMLKRHPLDEAPKCYTNKPMEHHGIIPTGKVPNFNDGSWSKHERLLFEECAKAFVTALHPPAKYNTLQLEGVAHIEGLAKENPCLFSRSLEQITEPGWMALSGKDVEENSKPLPVIDNGRALPIDDVTVTAKQTTPPKPFTEDTLLAAMINAGRQTDGENAKLLRELSGIGTPATRANIIETLKARNYINVAKTITSTSKGQALIQYVPKLLADVDTTAEWEKALKEIEETTSDEKAMELRNAFLREQMNFATNLIKEAIEKMSDVENTNQTTSGQPTEKMIALVEKLGKQFNVDTAEALSSFDAAKEFLDEYLAKAKDAPNPPTEKMAALVKKIGEQLQVDVTEALASFDAAKAFLDENMNKAKNNNPPTAKMISFAKSLATKKELELPEDVETSFDSCKAFIDKAVNME